MKDEAPDLGGDGCFDIERDDELSIVGDERECLDHRPTLGRRIGRGQPIGHRGWRDRVGADGT